MVERSSIDAGAITVFTATGPVTYQELIATVEASYASLGAAVLWDITNGSFVAMEQGKIRPIAQRVAGVRKVATRRTSARGRSSSACPARTRRSPR